MLESKINRRGIGLQIFQTKKLKVSLLMIIFLLKYSLVSVQRFLKIQAIIKVSASEKLISVEVMWDIRM